MSDTTCPGASSTRRTALVLLTAVLFLAAGLARVQGAHAVAPSATMLSASTVTAVAGQPVTFTATVSGFGGPVPTGTVAFSDNAGVLGVVPLFGGIAVLNATLPFLVGSFSDTVIANYSGDINYAPSTSNAVTITVGAGAQTFGLALSSSPNPSVSGQTVTFTAVLVAAGACGLGGLCQPTVCGGAVVCPPGVCGGFVCPSGVCSPGVVFCVPGIGGTLGGTVGFLDNGATIGIATMISGVATFSTSSLAVGVHTITAVFGGGLFSFAPTASSIITQTVNPGVGGTTGVTGALGITIVSGSGTPPSEGMTPGCNQVTLRDSPNTAISALAGLVAPFGAVSAIWRFDNGVKIFLAGYFSTSGAPTDITVTVGGVESYFFCVSQGSTITSQ